MNTIKCLIFWCYGTFVWFVQPTYQPWYTTSEIRVSRVVIIVFSFLITLIGGSLTVSADLADELGDLEGYTVVASERIAEFEGCEHGKFIKFESGEYVVCQEYGYQFAFHTDAILLLRSYPYISRIMLTCKMIVEDEIYDVNCTNYVRRQISILIRLRQNSNAEMREYIDWKLRIFGFPEIQ